MLAARQTSPVTVNRSPKARDADTLALSVSLLAPHAGEEGAEAWVGVKGRELQRAPEVLDIALPGVHGPLDVVEGVAELAAPSLDAGQRGEGGGVARVCGDGPLQDLLRDLEVVGRVIEARVRVQGAGVCRIRLERLHEVLFSTLHVSPALVYDGKLQVGLRVLRVEGEHGLVGPGRSRFVAEGEPGLPEGNEVTNLILPKRNGLLREPERLGWVLSQGEEVGGELVPNLGRTRTVFEAPPESCLGPLQFAVAGVADAEVRVGLPPVWRRFYDLFVGADGLRVAAEHVEGVGPEGPSAALLHLVSRGLYGLLEELQRLGEVGGVEEGEACVYEHIGVLWYAGRPALEGGLGQRRLAHKPVVAAQLHVGVRVSRVSLYGPLQVVYDLERLVARERHHRKPHPRRDPLGVQLQGVKEAGLGLLEPAQVQERAPDGLDDLRVLGGCIQGLLEAREGLLYQPLARQGLTLLQVLVVVHRP